MSIHSTFLTPNVYFLLQSVLVVLRFYDTLIIFVHNNNNNNNNSTMKIYAIQLLIQQ